MFVSNHFFRRSTGNAPPVDPQFVEIHELFHPFDQYIYIYIVQIECNLAKMITLFQAPFLFQHCTRCELGVCKLNPDSVVWHTDASFAQYSSFNFAPREVGQCIGHRPFDVTPIPISKSFLELFL